MVFYIFLLMLLVFYVYLYGLLFCSVLFLVVRCWLAKKRLRSLRTERDTLQQAHCLIQELNESLCSLDFSSINNIPVTAPTSLNSSLNNRESLRQNRSRNIVEESDHEILNFQVANHVKVNENETDFDPKIVKPTTENTVKVTATETREKCVESGDRVTKSPYLGLVSPCSLPTLLEEARMVEKYPHLVHLEVRRGIVSIRRLPRVSNHDL